MSAGASIRIGWLDCSSGVAGDMLLAALADLGALDGLDDALGSLPGLRLRVTTEPVRRGALRAIAVTVISDESDPPRRSLADILTLLSASSLTDSVRQRAVAVFQRLAQVEAAVHGLDVADVHFHEVGAADSIADVVGCCFGLHALGLDRLAVSTITLGGGQAITEHGTIPIPGPAVLGLLAASELSAVGSDDGVELATPTGVAVAAEWATQTGPMPPMRVTGTGTGAGRRELPGRANVVRLVVGEAATHDADSDADADAVPDVEWWQIEANVDDLDPRLWPGVIDAVLHAGAADAWLSPIQMKKGRPAHTLHALVPITSDLAVRQAIFERTSTIGLRRHAVRKTALERQWRRVEVAGQSVRIKLAGIDGRVMTATPEWADVEAAAAATGLSARRILDQPAALAADLVSD